MTEYRGTISTIRFTVTAALLLIGWWCVALYTPSSVFFRDSGEFILAGFYLDIVHPPGYPLFAQLSNLFALLPAGPIAWRVHLFAGFTACALLLFTGLTTARFIRLLDGGRGEGSLRRTSFAIIAPLWLIASPAFLRGALTAEGYVLHGFFLLALLNCLISYRTDNDLRWLIGASFLGGLSLGNHISGALAIAPVAVLILLDIRRTARAIIPGFLMGILGTSIYGYIPVRALATPPLNTGSPTTFERLEAHLTDARDRVLRPRLSSPPGSNILPQSRIETATHSIRHNLGTLSGELSPILLSGALLGLLALLAQQTFLGVVVTAVIGGNLWFFSGWDPDPWVISLALCSVLFSVCASTVAASIKRPRLRLTIVLALFGGALATLPHREAPLHIGLITNFSAAQDIARTDADRLPSGAPFITEASWFIAQYLNLIEGYRGDLLPVYQPSILFPQLFSPLDLTLGTERIVATVSSNSSQATSHFENLDRYIDRVSGRGPVFFEPTIELNARLREVARLEAGGQNVLSRGKPHALEPAYLARVRGELAILREKALNDPLFFGADTQQYLETRLTYHADLLRVTGHPEVALALIDGVCPPNLPPCSITIDLNRGLYLTDLERVREAAEVILAAALREPTARQRLIPNLQRALSRLSPEDIVEFGRNPLHRTVIHEAGF